MGDYKDLFLDIEKFNEENISYVKPILFYKVTRNMGIYYRKETVKKIKSESNSKSSKKNIKKKNSSDNYETIKQTIKQTKKQKIIIQTPKMVAPFGVKEFDNNGKKSYQMSLSFNTMTNLYNEEEIKKFYLFIQKIDIINEETIMDYIKAWGLPKNLKYRKTLQRLSKEFPHHMNINLPYDEKIGFLFNIYNENAEKSTIDIIDKKSIVSVVVELTDLKFNDTEFRSNWTVMQIRKFKPYSPIQEFFMSGCFICDQDDPEDTAYAKLIEKYQKNMETPITIPKIPQLNPNYFAYADPRQQYQYPMQPMYAPNPYTASYTSQPGPYINHTIPPPPISKPNQPENNITSFKPPSLQELLSAKKSLKKTKTIVKGVQLGKVVDDDNNTNEISNIPPPPPPPTNDSNKKNTQSKNKSNKKDPASEIKSNKKDSSSSDDSETNKNSYIKIGQINTRKKKLQQKKNLMNKNKKKSYDNK